MVAANVQGKNKLQYIVKIFELRNSKKIFLCGQTKRSHRVDYSAMAKIIGGVTYLYVSKGAIKKNIFRKKFFLSITD